MREEDKQKAALVFKIYQTARELGLDELKIIDLIVNRLEVGQQRYGKFVLSADIRDWISEVREESLDAVVYSTCAAMKATNAADAAVAGRLLAIALTGVHESIPDAVRKNPVKPSLSDRIYFAVLGREIPMLVGLFMVVLAIATVVHFVRG